MKNTSLKQSSATTLKFLCCKIRNLFILLCITICINACKKEKFDNNTPKQEDKTTPEKSIIETIDFKSFLSSTKTIKSPKLSLLINKAPNQQNIIKLSSVDNYEGLLLFTDSIKKN